MKYNLQICRFSILATFTVELFLTITVLLIAQQVFGQAFTQFSDDFTDGDLTNSPSWSNANSTFVVTSQELRLQAPATAGVAYITTPSRAIDMASWEFFVRLEFNPSTANNVRIYLASDQPDLSHALNGYFVLIGSAEHDLCLYRQSGTTITKIIDGEDEKLNGAQVILKISVSRDDVGQWTLFSDFGSTGTFTIEGTAVEPSHTSSIYFGVLCNYTSTRSDKFYFDDFKVSGEFTPDTLPPELLSVKAVSPHELQLEFNEDLREETLVLLNNYHVSEGLDTPSKIVVQNKKSVTLYFEQEFSPGISYRITVSGITDMEGNTLVMVTKDFRFIVFATAQYKDVVLSELMIDPTPPVALPEVEFIELFNRSKNTFNLKDWELQIDDASVLLPDFVLQANSYVIVSSSGEAFANVEQVIDDDKFPSLNNSKDHIVLKSNVGVTLDSIQFTTSWYREQTKKNGGWSLELIDAENLCSGSENWNTSEDPSGGTPGRQNSVLANKPDVTGPWVIGAIPLSDTSILLRLNEDLENALPDLSSFSIEPSINIKGLSFSDGSLRNIELTLQDNLLPRISYTISVNSLYDCTGNVIDPEHNQISFGLFEAAEAGDIVINEILFDPKPGGVDFVEIVNTSSKYINLRGWLVGNVDQDQLTNAKIITNDDFLMPPRTYVVLTEDIETLRATYSFTRENNLIQVDQLPAFNDRYGSVGFVNPQHLMIDHFLYAKEMHSIFLKDVEGVSLERISFGAGSNDGQNWKSASALSGFATPGYLNSNAVANTISDEVVKVEPEVFVPLNGQPDFVRIQYALDQGGYVAKLNIQDEQGHVIKQLAQNELLGVEGYWRWDGDRDDGKVARLGYYMVWLELYDNSGRVRTIKRRLSVAARF